MDPKGVDAMSRGELVNEVVKTRLMMGTAQAIKGLLPEKEAEGGKPIGQPAVAGGGDPMAMIMMMMQQMAEREETKCR